MPAINPPLSLSDAERSGFARIRLDCAKCGRRGNYAIGRLSQRFGDDARLIAIREALTADCPRMGNYSDWCGARFEW